MEENSFWIAVWRCLGWTLVGLTAVIASCSSVADYRVAELVASGTNPIAARCAIWGAAEGKQVMCHEASKLTAKEH